MQPTRSVPLLVCLCACTARHQVSPEPAAQQAVPSARAQAPAAASTPSAFTARSVDTTPGLLPETALGALRGLDDGLLACLNPSAAVHAPRTHALLTLRFERGGAHLREPFETPGLHKTCVRAFMDRVAGLPEPYGINKAWATYQFDLEMTPPRMDAWWQPRRDAWARFCQRVGEQRRHTQDPSTAVLNAVKQSAQEETAPPGYGDFLKELVETGRVATAFAQRFTEQDTPFDASEADKVNGFIMLLTVARMVHQHWGIPIECEHIPRGDLDIALDDLPRARTAVTMTNRYERRHAELEGPGNYLEQRATRLRAMPPTATREEKEALQKELDALWSQTVEARRKRCEGLGGFTIGLLPINCLVPSGDVSENPKQCAGGKQGAFAEPCGNLCRLADHICEDQSTQGCVCPAGQCLAADTDGQTLCIPTPAWNGKLL